MKTQRRRKSLLVLLIIVLANYAAQVPYYFHQYYSPHRLLPSLVGSLMLLATLVWFSVAYRLLAKGNRIGWWLMLAYLVTVFLFYLQTQIMQIATAHQILLHVYHPNGWLLFAVFGIGYVNCIVALFYVVYLVNRRRDMVST